MIEIQDWERVFTKIPLNLQQETTTERMIRLGLTIESYRVDRNEDVVNLLRQEGF